MTETELKNYIAAIRPADRDAMAAARQRQAQLAKPPGSLGALEDMSVRLAGVTGRVCSPMNRCRVAVFAADNGVVDEGVSCAPRSVTVQQAVNMTRRKTGMSAMAAAFGDDVAVVDVGMDCGTTPAGILNRRVRRSTGEEWKTVDTVYDNTALETDRVLPQPVTARYVRLVVSKPDQSEGNTARIYEFEVY